MEKTDLGLVRSLHRLLGKLSNLFVDLPKPLREPKLPQLTDKAQLAFASVDGTCSGVSSNVIFSG